MATKEALAPLANVPIMLGRSIRLFRHLECQNPSIISGDIGKARSGQQFHRNGGMEEWNRGTERERSTVDTMSVLIKF